MQKRSGRNIHDFLKENLFQSWTKGRTYHRDRWVELDGVDLLSNFLWVGSVGWVGLDPDSRENFCNLFCATI